MATRRAVLLWISTLLASCAMLALPLVAYAATSAVSIQNSAFAPASITIKVGDSVTWTNRDAFSHTSTSDTGVWDTGVIRAGASGSFMFTSAGTFAYHCAIHSFMKGTIVVQGVTTPAPTQPPPPPPTPVPTPARTAPPTTAPTPEPTAAPSPESPSPSAAPSATPSPSAVAAASSAPTASAVVAAASPAAAPAVSGSTPIVVASAIAIVGLTGLAAFLLRRRG